MKENFKKNLENKINKKKVKIGIIGVGYVGLPLAINFVMQNFDVTSLDVDKKRIRKILKGESFINYISNDKIQHCLRKKYKLSNNFSKVKELDVIIICLPTPLKKNKVPDLSYVEKCIKNIYPYLKNGQLISFESTTYPGTTEEKIINKIKTKFKIGKNFFVVYSPEREDPSNKKFQISNIPRIVSGHSKNCVEIGSLIYSKIINKIVKVSSIKTAEMAKLLENIYRSVNIALVNEMKIVSKKFDVNIHEVIEAAATKPFGFGKFNPGPGLGGHCIPIDPFYLAWKAKKLGTKSDFIQLSGKVNSYVTSWIIDQIKRKNKINKNTKILLLGVAYKKNIGDIRESPAFKFFEKFYKNASIEYHDPYVKKLKIKIGNKNLNFYSQKISTKMIKNYDIVILLTDHDHFNYKMIEKNSKILVDTRGKFNKNNTNIIRL